MTVKEFLNQIRSRIGSPAAEQLLEGVLGVTRSYFFAHGGDELQPESALQAEALASRFAAGEPLQYLLHSAEFMGLDFYVDENVLIPRPETEQLCERAAEILREKRHYLAALSDGSLIDEATGNSKCTSCFAGKKGLCTGDVCTPEFPAADPDSASSAGGLSVLDICTGSGAIAVYLAHEFPEVCVSAGDISAAALAVARRNCAALCSSAQAEDGVPVKAVRFFESDLFAQIPGCFDLITANPPYIPTAVIEGLDRNVRDHEPHLALDGGASGFELPLRLIRTARPKLRPGGILLMEIGDDQGARALEAAADSGFRSCRILKDYAGQDRILEAGI